MYFFCSVTPPSLSSKDFTMAPYKQSAAKDLPRCGLYGNHESTLDGELLAHLFLLPLQHRKVHYLVRT